MVSLVPESWFGNEQTGLFSAVSAKVSYIDLQSLGKRQKGGHSDQDKSQNESIWRLHQTYNMIQGRHITISLFAMGGVKVIT